MWIADYDGRSLGTLHLIADATTYLARADDHVIQDADGIGLSISANEPGSLSSGSISGTLTDEGLTQVRMTNVILDVKSQEKLAAEVHRALTKSLQRKRRQWPHDDTPLVLVTSFPHTPMGHYLESVLEGRIWHNKTFSWLSGILVINPVFDQYSTQAMLWLNENTKNPVPSEFRALFQRPVGEDAPRDASAVAPPPQAVQLPEVN